MSRTLGYLSTSVRGLAASELEDLLSCDADVMHGYFADAATPEDGEVVRREYLFVFEGLSFVFGGRLVCV